MLGISTRKACNLHAGKNPGCEGRGVAAVTDPVSSMRLQAKRVAENIEPLADLSTEAAQYQARAIALGTQAVADKVSDDLKVSLPTCSFVKLMCRRASVRPSQSPTKVKERDFPWLLGHQDRKSH